MQAKVGTGNPVRGKKVFLQAGCGACHTIVAAGSQGTIGPNLDKTLRNKGEASIRQSIVEPNAVIAKGLGDLIAFLIQTRR